MSAGMILQEGVIVEGTARTPSAVNNAFKQCRPEATSRFVPCIRVLERTESLDYRDIWMGFKVTMRKSPDRQAVSTVPRLPDDNNDEIVGPSAHSSPFNGTDDW